MKKLIFLLVFISLISLSGAYPKIVPYVNDFADILTPEQEIRLNQLCDKIELNTSYEIAIVTIQNTEGQDRIEYANRIGDENGVGKKEKSNGIVVLWSLDNEKGGAIATGRGSESIFNDAKVGRIGRESRSLFDEEKYYEGFNYIVLELEKEIDTINLNDSPDNKQDKPFNILLIISIVFGVIIFFIVIGNEDSSSGTSIISGGFSSISSGSSSGVSFGGGNFGGGGGKF
jgi:uncharacterized protein